MTITVNGPNGVTINFPDGTDPTTINRVMTQATGGSAQAPASDKPQGPEVGALEAFGRGALQGASVNTSDEVYAGAKALTGGDYSKALKEVRDANRNASEKHPIASLAGEFTGGILPAAAATLGSMFFPGLAPAAEAVDAKTAAQGAGLLSRVWQGAKTGAKLGAGYAAGGYEGQPDESLAESAMGRVGAGLQGAAAGGVTGGLLTPAVDVAAGTVEKLANAARAIANPRAVALQKYGEALARDGVTDAAPVRDLAAGSQKAILGDAGGESTKDLIRVAFNRPNGQKQAFKDVLDERQKGQWGEIEDNLRKSLADPNEFEQTAQSLEASRAVNATEAYGSAHQAEFAPSPDLLKIFATDENNRFVRPTIGKVVDAVRTRLKDTHGDDAEAWADVNGLKFIHEIKTELDDKIGQARKASQRGDASSADKYDLRSLVGLKQQLLNGVAKSEGDGPQLYLAANKQYSNSKALENALALGREHAQATDDVIRSAMAEMGPAEVQHYKIGLARGLADKNRVGRETHDRVGRDWSDPQDQFRIQAMFGPKAEQMSASLDAMRKAVELRQATLGNSSTTKQIMANEDAKAEAEHVLGTLKTLGHAVTGNIPGLLHQAKDAAAARIQGINPRVAEEILKIASRPAGPTSLEAMTRMTSAGQKRLWQKRADQITRDRAIKALLSSGAAGLTGAMRSEAPN